MLARASKVERKIAIKPNTSKMVARMLTSKRPPTKSDKDIYTSSFMNASPTGRVQSELLRDRMGEVLEPRPVVTSKN